MVDSKRRNKENKKENQPSQKKEVASKPKQSQGAKKEQKSDPSSLLSKGDGADGQCHQVEEIIGCTEWKGQLVFLVKWVNEPDQQVVPAAIANVKYPQKVIEFYEKRIVWDQKE